MIQLEQIYKAYFSDVYRYVLSLSGSESTAEEITCDTFFKAMKGLPKFRGDCDIRVWLCQIAKNLYYSYIKKEKRSAPFDEEVMSGIEDTEKTAEERVQDRDDAEHIRRFLHELNEPYKEVFMWRVYGELSFKQIGELFGKTENWACVTYHRAKTMISRRTEEQK